MSWKLAGGSAKANKSTAVFKFKAFSLQLFAKVLEKDAGGSNKKGDINVQAP